MRKIGKIVLKIIGGLILLLFLLLLLLRIPYVQTEIAQFAAQKLSKQLGTVVSVDKVAMNFVDNASLKKIYIEDLNQDTLMYIEEINVELAFFKLFKSIIEVDQAILTRGVVNIKEESSGDFNFQFIVDAFTSADTVTTPQESTFKIDLDRMTLQDVRSRVDLVSGNHEVSFKNFDLRLNMLDLDAQTIDIDDLLLDGLLVNSTVLPTESDQSTVVKEETEIRFPLDGLPYAIRIKNTEITKVQVSFSEKGFKPGPNFDPRFIHLKDLFFSMKDFEINENKATGEIDEISFLLNDRFKLNRFKSFLVFNNQELSLKDFGLSLPNSRLDLTATLTYNSFHELVEMNEDLGIDINIPGTSIALDDLAYFFTVEELKPFRNDLLQIKGSAKGNLANLAIRNFLMEVGNTRILADGRILNPTESDRIGVRNFKLQGKADYEEYAVFLTNDTLKRQFQQIGDIRFQSTADGNLERINIDNLELYTESLAEAKFSGTLQNLSEPEKLTYDVKIHHITSGYQDAAIFVDSLPEILEKFDTISYSGQARGNLYDITLDGAFDTSLGDIDTDIAINFTPEYEDAVYEGFLELDDFQLGELLDNDSLGTISLAFDLDGSGLELDQLNTEIQGEISHVDYNGYAYQNIVIDGKVDGREFSGKTRINDENVKLDFLGSVDMNDSLPVMNFSLLLDTLNLEKLNLSDSMMQIQLDVHADIVGLNLDDADGDITVRNIKLRNSEMTWESDSVTLEATKIDGTKALYFSGEFIDASIEGDYQISYLPDAILDFLDQYFPLKRFLGQTKKEDPILTTSESQALRKDVVKADIQLYQIEDLAQFFKFPVEKMDTVSLDFTLDLPNNLTEFEFLMPSVTYDGYYAEGVRAIASNNPSLIKSSLAIDSISITEDIHLGGVNMDMIFRDQSAVIQALIRNQKNEKSLGFSTRISADDKNNFNVNFIKDFLLNNQQWALSQDSSIIINNGGYIIPTINLNNGEESFSIAGSDRKIDLSFTQFDLNNFVEIVGIDSMDIQGLMNGDLELGLDDETPISGDLKIDDIMFNEFDIGDLRLDARKMGQDVTAIFGIEGEEVSLEGDVDYDLSSEYMQGKVLVERLNLEPFDPFLDSYARNLKGSMQGYLAIDGQLEDPDITGALYFQEVEAYILSLNTVYKIKEGKVNVADNIIKPDVTLEDQSSRLSYLDGTITHDLFTDITFDLDFSAEEFMFLNSAKNQREYYYGTFVGKVDAQITGTSDLPVIDADITALDETDLTIQLLSSEAVLTQEQYIVFYDSDKINSEDALDSISQKAYEPNSSVELNLALSASSDALFHVIVDPVTGDKLDIRGNTDLIVTIPSDGDLSIIGEYTVSEGSYRVSYENTIRRTFSLDPGSRIVFQGDPYMAGLDMRAIYNTEVSTQALIANSGALSPEEVAPRADVNVVLNVGGTLAEPELSFDIVIPDNDSGPVGNALSNALAQLRQNETVLLEQVGSIILFNSFIGGSSGSNISSVGTATAVNSVGNLINNQLNKLSSRADGFEIDFDIDQYENFSREGRTTEFGLGVQQKLFNDRLIISAGGNANLETGEATTNFSSFAGDFVIQYLLTDSGKLRVKVFQKSDFDALSNSNVWKTGIGLSYKTKYGQIRPKK